MFGLIAFLFIHVHTGARFAQLDLFQLLYKYTFNDSPTPGIWFRLGLLYG